jgi:hypothetical protein
VEPGGNVPPAIRFPPGFSLNPFIGKKFRPMLELVNWSFTNQLITKPSGNQIPEGFDFLIANPT